VKSYRYGIPTQPQNIHYAIMEYKFFEIREVLIDEKPKGEYHVKLLDKSKLINAVSFLRKHLFNCEIGIIDPSGVLNLEYPIYIILKDELIKSSIISIFETMDKELQNRNNKL